MVKVSVIVPVYNPGPYIEPGIASMLAQTLPPGELEVLYVDDGSTDDTPARLDALAAEHPHIRVFHEPNSGWAGRPRNVGIREALGEYVQFLDQDDAMPPDALRRMHEMAVRNGSDIVIGKVASNFRPVPQHLFRHNVEACTVRDAPLISSLTPHKLFRTAFLREHGIRFPEGRVRLEDQLFMVRSYLAATRVSILADAVCYVYARRDDHGNAGSGRLDPVQYYGNLREILEVVIAGTEPGSFRTQLLRRFYKTGMLDRLSEPFITVRPPEEQAAIFREVHAIARDLIGDDVQAEMPTIRALRGRLLRAGRRDELLALAGRLAPLRALATLERARWTGSRLRVRMRAALVVGGPDRPFEVERQAGQARLDPDLLGGIVEGPVPVDEPEPWGRLELALRERATGEEWRVRAAVRAQLVVRPAQGSAAPGQPGAAERCHPVFHATAVIDMAAIAAGAPLGPGSWELRARVFGPGVDRRTTVLPGPGERPLPAAMVGRDGGPSVTLRVLADGVRLDVTPGSDGAVELPVDDPAAPPGGGLEVLARRRGSAKRIAAELRVAADAAPVLVLPRGALPAGGGPWRILARIDGPDTPERVVGTVLVAAPEAAPRAPWRGPRIPLLGRGRRLARRLVPGAARSLRRRLRAALARWR